MTAAVPSRRRRTIVTVVMILVFLVPACYGFTNKFLEFLALLDNEEGAFAVMPVLNYLLCAVGFTFLLLWAGIQGMFRDVEKPKYLMLQREEQLDREAEEEADERRWR